jgi:hypothetical protein
MYTLSLHDALPISLSADIKVVIAHSEKTQSAVSKFA